LSLFNKLETPWVASPQARRSRRLPAQAGEWASARRQRCAGLAQTGGFDFGGAILVKSWGCYCWSLKSPVSNNDSLQYHIAG
jgi:hypothetical protein